MGVRNALEYARGEEMKEKQFQKTESGIKTIRKNFHEKIDIYSHILPPKYNEALYKKARPCYNLETNNKRPALYDLNMRFRAMDKFEGLRQVLSLGAPPLENVLSAKDAVELSRRANDELAELVYKFPDRFAGGVASLPMNDIDASVCELDRAINDLNLKGIQIFSSINRKPLDRPEFVEIFKKMAQYDLPIWLHPAKDNEIPDYPDEKSAKFGLFVAFGWPYETTLAMARLVIGGIFERYPNLKIIAHHCGAMIPFFSKRVPLSSQAMQATGEGVDLTKPLPEYFKKFYADTVLGGNTPALMCGYSFFGADNILFGTDYPYPGGPEHGDLAAAEVIKSVELMNVSEEEKTKMFFDNARRILRLS
jgi:predicted TIM-barrel fold metal-dependent hydrolase